MRLHEEFIVKAVEGVSFECAPFPSMASFEIDSRTLKQGDMFVALPGVRTDGHRFINEVIQKGAAGVLINKGQRKCLESIAPDQLKKLCVMVVPNTLQAVVQLATAWRKQFGYSVVAITGSYGKTLVKERLSIILDLAGKNYLATRGNQNTQLGLSLNVLRMRPEHELAVFELGISRRGEMKKLVSIAQPTLGLITAVGHSHMEGLGSLSDIAAEKRELFSSFHEDSIGIVNGDQRLLANVAYNHPVVKFGLKTTNQIQARKINYDGTSMSFVMKLYKQKFPITIKSSHNGAVENALAAAACAYLLEVPTQTIVDGIQRPLVVEQRFEHRELVSSNGIVIDDCYNASPESMKEALLALERYKTSAQKIAVLGDMLELGSNSPFWHRQLGRFMRKVPSLRKVILVGSAVEWTKKTMPIGVEIDHVANWQEAQKVLAPKLTTKSVVLVKGSRGIGLDNLVNAVCHKSA